MKRIFLLLISVFAVFSSFGQTFNFSSDKFNTDYNIICQLSNEYKHNNKVWANELLTQFPVDNNGVIKLKYTITCSNTIDFEKCMQVTTNWFTYSFNSAAAIKKHDSEGIIYGEGRYINISQYTVNAVYYAKVVNIHANTQIGIKINDNTIDIIVYIKHYNLIYGDSLGRSENSLVLIKDAYPCIDSKNKVAYSMAFINCYAVSFEKIKNYIEFLNTNMNTKQSEIDFMW